MGAIQEPPREIHLLVIIHGLWGSAAHVSSIVDTIQRTHEAVSPRPAHDLRVLCAKTNESDFTYDGIDNCAYRCVDEIDAYMASLAPASVTKFSMVGYSLGGLIARFVLGILESREDHQSPDGTHDASGADTGNFFDGIEPVNFTTFASPAIGIPVFPIMASRFLNYCGARLLSRTGRQLYVKDEYLNGRPLLEIMAQPGTSFHNALLRFRHLHIYANALNDRTVPFAAGFFPADGVDPFSKADRLARLRIEETEGRIPLPLEEVDLSLGGMRIELEEECKYVIQKVEEAGPSSRRQSISDEQVANGDDVEERSKLLGAKCSKKSGSARTGQRRRPLRQRITSSIPFFMRPSTFSSIPYGLNYVLPILMPLLIPSFMVYIVSRFLIQGVSSRKRIRLMTSHGELSTLEGQLRRVGLALEDTFDELAEEAFPLDGSAGSSTSSERERESTDAVLSPAQRRIASNLNETLPKLKKHLVYLPTERNSHGAIICRDERWQGHRKGKEVLKFWADRFEM